MKAQFRQRVRPNGAILSVAGNIEWEPLKAQVEGLFSGWEPGGSAEIVPEPHQPTSGHIEKDTQQTQIALAFPSVPVTDPDYYSARAAVSVLSGGMSSRLFTEVREKRGLCYSVYAFHETFKSRGTLFAYAGTRAERAQETLDVTLAELKRLKDGIEGDEIDRVKAGLKSSLIMQEESTGAGGGHRDRLVLPRPRPLVRRDSGHHRRPDASGRPRLPGPLPGARRFTRDPRPGPTDAANVGQAAGLSFRSTGQRPVLLKANPQ